MTQNQTTTPERKNILQEIPKPIVLSDAYRGQLIAVPEGFRLETDNSLLETLHHPVRKKGSVSIKDLDSFVEYVNRYKQQETILYAKVDEASTVQPLSITAVFNEHSGGSYIETNAGWRDFTAAFTPEMSHEWKIWSKQDRCPLNQIEFAEFIEENSKDIVSLEGFPTAVQMLAMATNLEIYGDMRYKSSVRLQSGSFSFEFVDQEDNETIKKMEVFQKFCLGFAPFWNGQAYTLEAKLRYRKQEGKVIFQFYLNRPDLIIKDATKDLIEKIKSETCLPIIYTK